MKPDGKYPVWKSTTLEDGNSSQSFNVGSKPHLVFQGISPGAALPQASRDATTSISTETPFGRAAT